MFGVNAFMVVMNLNEKLGKFVNDVLNVEVWVDQMWTVLVFGSGL